MARSRSQDIMNKPEAARMLGVSIRTLDYLVFTKQVPFIRFGKRALRFSRDRLTEWLKERENVEYRLRRKSNGHTGC
jgi:excisionase family DNA binding protein